MAELQARSNEIGQPGGRRLELSRLVGAGVVAAIAAIAAADILYLAAGVAGQLDGRTLLPSMIGMGPLSLASVSLTAGAAVAGACVVFGILLATVRRPVRVFRVLATGLALASLAMPATIPGPAMTMRLVMVSMHVAVWAAVVGVLAPMAGGRGRAAE